MKLVIAEKPSVAQSIAKILKADERKNGYMEGNEYIVAWCVGHLIELAQPDGIEKYSFTKNGEEKFGVQYKFVMEFPKKKTCKEKMK